MQPIKASNVNDLWTRSRKPSSSWCEGARLSGQWL